MTASGPTSAAARSHPARKAAGSSTRQALARVNALSSGLASGLRTTGNRHPSAASSSTVRGQAVQGWSIPNRPARA